MEKLKNYNCKELARVINELIEQNKELKRELGYKVGYDEYRQDPIGYE